MRNGASDDWRKEWVGMPEFIQEQERPYSKIIVRIADEETLQRFAELIGQPLTPLTKSIWFPKRERGEDGLRFKRYVDES